MSERKLIINGIEINYDDYFSKNREKLILVHGMGGDHRGLLDFALQLKNYHIYSFDLPGYGKSKPLDKEHSIKNYAEFIEAFRKALGIGKVNLVGHSFGGSIVVNYAERYSKYVKKLVLLNPVLDGSATTSARLSRLYAKLAFIFPDRISHFFLGNHLIVYISDRAILTRAGKLSHRRILDQDYRNYKRLNIRALRESIYSLDSLKLSDFSRIHSIKTLIVLGDSDALVDPESLISNTQIAKNIDVLVVPGGHLLPLEDPVSVAGVVNKFLAK